MLHAKKAEWERAKYWNEKNQKEWYDLYIPPFRDALRQLVREKLMIQASKTEKINVDEKEYDKEYEGQLKRLRELNLLGSKGFTAAEVAKAVRENLTIATYESKFSGLLEQPTRPEVQQYYKDNLARFQRKAGVMVRLIRIDRFVTNTLTKQQTVREDALERAQEVYQNVHDYGADFKEVARMKSDDAETRERGGLILPDIKDPFFDLDTCNPSLAKAIHNLPQTETITPVFEYLNSSWAVAQVVSRREAGPEPLEGPLYDRIFKELMRSKSSKKSEEWFRKALSTNLVCGSSKNSVWTPKTDELFFPDEVKDEKNVENENEKDNLGAK